MSKYFESFNFQTGEALQMIRTLSKLRSDDHLVQLNASVVRFEAGEIATIDELDYCLKKGIRIYILRILNSKLACP